MRSRDDLKPQNRNRRAPDTSLSLGAPDGVCQRGASLSSRLFGSDRGDRSSRLARSDAGNARHSQRAAVRSAIPAVAPVTHRARCVEAGGGDGRRRRALLSLTGIQRVTNAKASEAHTGHAPSVCSSSQSRHSLASRSCMTTVVYVRSRPARSAGGRLSTETRRLGAAHLGAIVWKVIHHVSFRTLPCLLERLKRGTGNGGQRVAVSLDFGAVGRVLEPERAAVDETLRSAMDTMAAYHSSPGDDMAMTVPTPGVKQPGFLSALSLRTPRKVAGAAEHSRAITDRPFRVRACRSLGYALDRVDGSRPCLPE
jgi:hypothetical protein